MKNEWFEDWFASPYYFKLYKHRNEEEAACFMDKLINYLDIDSNAKLLDAACGKGRHSIYLNQKGFNVTGIDLSAPSINLAKKSENERLAFFVHDIRKTFRSNYFNAVLNLFTSFGYFENSNDNVQCLKAFREASIYNGDLIIDFINATKAISELKANETKTIDGIDFHISKKYTNGFIRKKIKFQDNGKSFEFEEKVQALDLEDFKTLFDKANLKLIDHFGDYDLSEYNQNHSNRLILHAKSK